MILKKKKKVYIDPEHGQVMEIFQVERIVILNDFNGRQKINKKK